MSVPLAVLENVIDASGVAPRIEGLLPAGVRRRQLTVRTLFLGMQLTLADARPAQLTRVHAALTGLPEADQIRLGVTAVWKTGPHKLTYRQVEHTCRLITRALAKDEPDGAPGQALQSACDQLLEASIPALRKNASTALAGDWTDVESWSRPPRHGSARCADPEAAWGHRNSNLPGPKGEMFFGYFLSAVIMTTEENGPAVPELARRMTLAGCDHDPVRALAPTLEKMPQPGSRSATSWQTPATPTATRKHGPSRSAAPAPSWCRTCTRTTAVPAAPMRARSSPTATSTARKHPAPCWNSARCRPAPRPKTPARTTSRQPSYPGTS